MYDGDITELIYTGERTSIKDWSRAEGAPKDQTSDLYTRLEKIKSQVQKTLRPKTFL